MRNQKKRKNHGKDQARGKPEVHLSGLILTTNLNDFPALYGRTFVGEIFQSCFGLSAARLFAMSRNTPMIFTPCLRYINNQGRWGETRVMIRTGRLKMFYRAKEERSSEKYKNINKEMVLGAKRNTVEYFNTCTRVIVYLQTSIRYLRRTSS